MQFTWRSDSGGRSKSGTSGGQNSGIVDDLVRALGKGGGQVEVWDAWAESIPHDIPMCGG